MQPGEHIGDYELVRPLGAGGMAQVWLARHPRMNRQVAVKFILDQYLHSPEIRERFNIEAWRQSGLQHPNIVHVETVLTAGERDFIVMQYVPFGLDKRLAALAGRPLALPEAIDMALQLLDALDYTHHLAPPDGPLIHRDIKPSNILLTSDGTVRLTDFGIALATGAARRTLTGQALGTAFYMSPEQIRNPARVDARTDIYSAGCVLYEMLTGRPPFGKDDDTDFTIQHEHCYSMPAPLRRSNPTIPERFEWIVLKALVKDVEFRFSTAREMASVLLTAYREEGLPVEQLHNYRGGLTPLPAETSAASAHRATLVEKPAGVLSAHSTKPETPRPETQALPVSPPPLFSSISSDDSKTNWKRLKDTVSSLQDGPPMELLHLDPVNETLPKQEASGPTEQIVKPFAVIVSFALLSSLLLASLWAAVAVFVAHRWGLFIFRYIWSYGWTPMAGWVVALLMRRISPTQHGRKYQLLGVGSLYLFPLFESLAYRVFWTSFVDPLVHFVSIPNVFLSTLLDPLSPILNGLRYGGKTFASILNAVLFSFGLFMVWRMTGRHRRTLRTLFKS